LKDSGYTKLTIQDDRLVNGSTGIIHDYLTIDDAHAQGIYIPARVLTAMPDYSQKWPVVDFIPPPHVTPVNGEAKHIRTLIARMAVTVDNASGDMEATRNQIPLMLAWGMTIHKAQVSIAV
jgi:hypothetical protein